MEGVDSIILMNMIDENRNNEEHSREMLTVDIILKTKSEKTNYEDNCKQNALKSWTKIDYLWQWDES